jgi:hypothetical protein
MSEETKVHVCCKVPMKKYHDRYQCTLCGKKVVVERELGALPTVPEEALAPAHVAGTCYVCKGPAKAGNKFCFHCDPAGIQESDTILQEAGKIVYGDREQTYGKPGANLERIAAGWAVIFEDGIFTPEKVALAMTWLKIARELHRHKRDNLVDACGYLALIEKMERAAPQ